MSECKYCKGKVSPRAEKCPHCGEPDPTSACFLTTACIQHAGLEDSCQELTIMRDFRDNYLSKQKDGDLLIGEYYSIAPKILSEINKTDNANKIYKELYENLVLPVVDYIQSNNNEAACQHYQDVVNNLKCTYRGDL